LIRVVAQQNRELVAECRAMRAEAQAELDVEAKARLENHAPALQIIPALSRNRIVETAHLHCAD